MPAPPPKASIVLPSAQRSGRSKLGLAVLAAAEDAVVERAVGPGQDLDLSEPAVGLGVESGRHHQVDRDQRRGGLAAGVRGVGHHVGNHGERGHGEMLDLRPVALPHLEHADRDERPRPRIRNRPPSPVGKSATFSTFTVRSLSGSGRTCLLDPPSPGRKPASSRLVRVAEPCQPGGPAFIGGLRKSSTSSGRSTYEKTTTRAGHPLFAQRDRTAGRA